MRGDRVDCHSGSRAGTSESSRQSSGAVVRGCRSAWGRAHRWRQDASGGLVERGCRSMSPGRGHVRRPVVGTACPAGPCARVLPSFRTTRRRPGRTTLGERIGAVGDRDVVSAVAGVVLPRSGARSGRYVGGSLSLPILFPCSGLTVLVLCGIQCATLGWCQDGDMEGADLGEHIDTHGDSRVARAGVPSPERTSESENCGLGCCLSFI